MAGTMLAFLLSFVGIPLGADFVGEFLMLSDAFVGGFGWLVGFAPAYSAVTAFYYSYLVHLIFLTEANPGACVAKSKGLACLTVPTAIVATILLGVFPGPVLLVLSQIVILLP